MRPAHIHFLIWKPGYKTQFSQVYSSDDPNLETDAQFGVTEALVGRYARKEGDPARYVLEHMLVVEPGEATMPEPPITGKAT